MSKTQIRGPQKQGAHILDTEVARMVVDSYSRNTTEEAKRDGQAAAAAILPLRRHLWALAERLVPINESPAPAAILKNGRQVSLPAGVSLIAPTKIGPFLRTPLLCMGRAVIPASSMAPV